MTDTALQKIADDFDFDGQPDPACYYQSPEFQAELRATKAFDWEEAAAVIVARSLAFKERCARAAHVYTSAALPA